MPSDRKDTIAVNHIKTKGPLKEGLSFGSVRRSYVLMHFELSKQK